MNTTSAQAIKFLSKKSANTKIKGDLGEIECMADAFKYSLISNIYRKYLFALKSIKQEGVTFFAEIQFISVNVQYTRKITVKVAKIPGI